MRVTFVVYGNLDRRSGGFLYDDELRKRLVHHGHQVSVVSQREGPLPALILQNFVPIRIRILRQKPDVLLIDELNHPSMFAAVGRLRRSGIPVVAVVHHLRSREILGRLERVLVRGMERVFLQGINGLILNSPDTEASVRSLIGRLPEASIVITPGADNPRRPRGAEGEVLRVLFVGNIIQRKGLHRLITALCRILEPVWELDVVGREDLEPSYSALCRSLAGAYRERIRFHGRLENDRLESLRGECRVLAVPSDLEGFGIVYLEAMRASMIPVAGAKGGASALIHDGTNGFLVSPDDTRRLEQILRRLAADADLRVTLSEEALKRSWDFPGWDESMDRAEAFLQEFTA